MKLLGELEVGKERLCRSLHFVRVWFRPMESRVFFVFAIATDLFIDERCSFEANYKYYRVR